MKNVEQIKALVDFLEYLFLIQDPDIERKYEEFKREMGGVFKITVDEIRKLHYTQKGIEEGIQKGIEEGIQKGKIEDAKNFLKLGIEEDLVAKGTGLSLETIKNIKKELYLN